MSAATHPTPAGLRRALSALQLICVIGTVISFRTEAVVYFVRTNGNDALPGTSWVQAKQTLGNAVATAAAGDEIWVATGIYVERITLKSGLKLYGGFQGTETDLALRNWATHITTIYHTNGPVVTGTNTDRTTCFDGFTVAGGIGTHGGGIKTVAAATVIAHNTIVGNNAPPTFLGHFGGGIALTLNTNGIVVANNLVVSNSSGIYRYPYVNYEPVLLHNCLNNSNANYVNLAAGTGDIQADPQFVNRAAGDFRLQGASPCIDAGTNAFATSTDFDGVGRPLDGDADGLTVSDIGAFEFVHPAADTDRDGMPDAAELIAGTEATNAASMLRLMAFRPASGNGVALR